MTDLDFLPDQRFVLRQLARGGLLWLYDPSPSEDAWLHTERGTYAIARHDFDALLERGLIAPVLGVLSKLYGITDAGHQHLADAPRVRRAG